MQYLHKENNANREAFQLSRTLYINGETDFLNVITAQRSWLSSEESLVTMKQNIRKARGAARARRAEGGNQPLPQRQGSPSPANGTDFSTGDRAARE